MKNYIQPSLTQFLNESKLRLKKVDALSKAYDAVSRKIIDENDLRELEEIQQMIESGDIKRAQERISKLDSLVKPFAPELPK